MIETRLLHYFLAIAREQSITRAAQTLFLSQSTLSKQMMDLERQLGKQLFHRGKRRITLTEDGVFLRNRAQEILELLSQKGLPLALATSAGAGITRLKLDRSGLGQYFQVVVTGDMVSRGKPDPEIYLAACQSLGTAPARTLAVEDSPSGVLSASRAGMPVAMVPDLIPPTPDLEPLLAVCRADLPSLSKWLAERL